MINEFKSGLDQQISEKNNLKTKAINDGKLNDFNVPLEIYFEEVRD